LIVKDVRFFKDSIYTLLGTFKILGNITDRFIKFLLINNFDFEDKKVSRLHKLLRQSIPVLTSKYKSNREHFYIKWKLEINIKETLSAKLYYLATDVVTDMVNNNNNFNFNRENFKNFYRFANIFGKLHDDLKQILCCKVYRLNNSHISDFYMTHHNLIELTNMKIYYGNKCCVVLCY